MHEVDVFRQRLAQGARHRLDTAVGDEPAADLGFDQFLEHLEPAVEVLAGEALVERAVADLRVLLRLFHHLRDEALGVELPQRPVEVVRTTHRAAGFHARVPRDCRTREQSQLLAVHVHQRIEEHLRELFVRHLTHRAGGFHRLAQLLEVGFGAFAFGPGLRALDARAEHREVHLEHRVEHLGVPVVLHERRAERSLERVTVLERHVLDRAHRVEVLGHRHGQARDAQLVHEALQHVEHRQLGPQPRSRHHPVRSPARARNRPTLRNDGAASRPP